jgi:hypothetical protein
MAERKHHQNGANDQNVMQQLSPIYQALQPDWNKTETLHRPLIARGDFSNAWVFYDQSELPPKVQRPTAMIDSQSKAGAREDERDNKKE